MVLVAIASAVVVYGVPLGYGEVLGPVGLAGLSILLLALPSAILPLVSIEGFVVYWLSLSLLQNALTGSLMLKTAADVPIALTEAKSVSAFIAVVVCVPSILRYLKERPLLRRLVVWYALLLLISLRFVARAVEFTPSLLGYGRNFVLALALGLLVATRVQPFVVEDRYAIARRVVLFVATLLGVGSISEVMLGTETWRAALNLDRIDALAALSTSTTFLGINLDRYAGFIGEPTNCGYIASATLSAIVLIAMRRKRHDVPLAVAAVTCTGVLLASAAKNGFLLMSAVALFLILMRGGRRPFWPLALTWGASGAITFLYLGLANGFGSISAMIVDPISNVWGDGVSIHIAGFVSGITEGVTTFIGHGLGQGGNFSKILSGTETVSFESWLGTGSESGWGVLAYQLGIVGLVMFLLLIVALSTEWGVASAALLAGWSASAMFAEAPLGPQVGGVLVVLAALIQGAPASPATLADHGGDITETPEVARDLPVVLSDPK